jgi:hypothetical protein
MGVRETNMTTCHEIPKGCEECDGEGCDKCCERDDLENYADSALADADADDMDGDAGSALASAGFGTDEDYGGFSDFDD